MTDDDDDDDDDPTVQLLATNVTYKQFQIKCVGYTRNR